MNIVDYNKVLKVIEDEELALVIPDFYKINNDWMRMEIILKKTKEIIGYIEFNFIQDSDNFYDYKGNVSYEINKEYQRFGYATHSLKLLKAYLSDKDMIDKTLYVSTEFNNVFSQRVALKNGGELVYEGDVPSNSVVKIYNKIDRVKIYRIENM